MYQSRNLAFWSHERKRGWSFMYGGMGYAGRYQVDKDPATYRYGGALLHGAVRMHLPIANRFTFVLEPALSLFYEDEQHPRFRQEVREDSLSSNYDSARSLSATLLFSQMLNYRLNDHLVTHRHLHNRATAQPVLVPISIQRCLSGHARSVRFMGSSRIAS